MSYSQVQRRPQTCHVLRDYRFPSQTTEQKRKKEARSIGGGGVIRFNGVRKERVLNEKEKLESLKPLLLEEGGDARLLLELRKK